jgi:hypothetical protein
MRSGRGGLDDDVADVAGRPRLPADQAQHQLVIGLDQPGRIDHVAAADGVQDVRNRDARLHQFGGVRLHFELGHLAALHDDGGDAGLPVEAGLEFVVGHLPELVLREFVRGQAVTHDRERRESQAVHGNLGGGRQAGLGARHGGVYQFQRAVHIHLPGEEQVDFRRAAAGDTPQMIQPGHRVDGLFDGPGDRDQHLVDGENAVVDAHHDARKIRLRKNRDRNGEREISTHGDEGEDDEDDGLAVAGRPVRRVGRRDLWADRVAHLDLGLASSFF